MTSWHVGASKVMGYSPEIKITLLQELGHKLIKVKYMCKTYLCTVMTDWVDIIKELGGGGVMDEYDP